MSSAFPGVDDVEALILKFYNPRGHPERSQIDKILIDLQKGPQGFQLADGLLKSDLDEVRFFGATTFIVKITDDLRTLDVNSKQELLDRLIAWLLTATSNNFRPRTVRKLCASLVAYFVCTDGQWSNCVVHVFASLLRGMPTNVATIEDLELDITNAVTHLGPKQTASLFAFISTLVEEIGKISSGSSKALVYNENIIANVPAMAAMIGYGIENAGRIDTTCSEDAIKCYASVVLWSKEAVGEFDDAITVLRPPFVVLLTLLLSDDEKIMEFFNEINDAIYKILTDYPRFLNEEYYGILGSALLSPKATEWLNRLLEGAFDEEPWAIGRLLLAFGEIRMEDLVTRPDDQASQELLSRLCRLTRCKGIAAVEDELILETVEFWSSLIERLGDDHFESNGELGSAHWLAWRDGMLLDVFEAFFEKNRLPETSKLQNSPSDTQEKFTMFRVSAQGIFASILVLLGKSLVDQLISHLRIYRRISDWRGVEASLHAINGLDSAEKDAEDYIVASVLSVEDPDQMQLFEHLTLQGESLSLATRRQAISFITNWIDVLVRNQSCLLRIPSILQFLSICLKIPHSADASAGAISELCIAARNTVTSILPDLYLLYQFYASSEHRSPRVQARLAGAVAAVIQASTMLSSATDAQRCNEAVSMFSSILDAVQMDIETSLITSTQNPERLHELALSALSCLKSMGKAFRVPEDEVIDLDEEEAAKPKSIWAERPELTAELQARILNLCTHVLSKYSGEEEIEEVCSILRSGFTESEPGPFVFPMSATESFVRQCHLSTPRIGLVLEMALVILNKHRSSSSLIVRNYALGCLKHIRNMLQGFFKGNPSEDPEVASLVMDFFREYIPKYTDCLLNGDEPDDLRNTFDFALACLESEEILPKRSAAAFWAALIAESYKSKTAMEGIEECLARYGERLTAVLTRQVGGGASRSQLDELCVPLKAIVFKGGRFREYFKDAVTSLSIQKDRVSLPEKRVFAEQILRLRGGTQTNKVVKEFWAACRGTFTMP